MNTLEHIAVGAGLVFWVGAWVAMGCYLVYLMGWPALWLPVIALALFVVISREPMATP